MTKSRIPDSITEAWGEDVRVDKTGGLGDVYNRPAEVFVIRRADREIWMRIPTEAGHPFRREAGQRSDLMSATIPR